LANGQVGALSWTFDGTVPLGEFIPAGTTGDEVDAIKVVQGTPNSQNLAISDVWEVKGKDRMESGIIRNGSVRSIATTKYDVGNFGLVAAEDFANIEGDTEYTAYIRILSHRRDRDFGNNDDVLHVHFDSPDYANLNFASDEDHLLSNMVYKINQRSVFTPGGTGASAKGTKPIIAFGINVAGAGGTDIGTVKAGDAITYQTENGVDAIYIATPAFVAALGELINAGGNIVAATTIELVDIEQAGAGDVNGILIVGFDEQTAAYFDDIAFVRTTIEASFGGGFITPATRPAITEIRPREEANSGRNVLIAYRNMAGLNVHTMQNHPHGEYFSRGVEYVKEDQNYAVTIIEYTEVEETLTGRMVTQAKLVVPISAEIADITTDAADVAANLANGDQGYPTQTLQPTTVLELNDTLGAWLATSTGVTYAGVATPNAIFV